jgi:trimethylamine:corrinoid methyltransferase-like protein
MVKRALKGIDVNKDTIDLRSIGKVVKNNTKGTTFLSEKHTRDFMKKEIFIPQLMDRNRRATWKKKGSKDLIILATEKANDLLNNFTEYNLSKSIENELKEYIESVNKRTYDDYAKLEGISSTKVSLPDSEK